MSPSAEPVIKINENMAHTWAIGCYNLQSFNFFMTTLNPEVLEIYYTITVAIKYIDILPVYGKGEEIRLLAPVEVELARPHLLCR